jgi:hypothetical protein
MHVPAIKTPVVFGTRANKECASARAKMRMRFVHFGAILMSEKEKALELKTWHSQASNSSALHASFPNRCSLIQVTAYMFIGRWLLMWTLRHGAFTLADFVLLPQHVTLRSTPIGLLMSVRSFALREQITVKEMWPDLLNRDR